MAKHLAGISFEISLPEEDARTMLRVCDQCDIDESAAIVKLCALWRKTEAANADIVHAEEDRKARMAKLALAEDMAVQGVRDDFLGALEAVSTDRTWESLNPAGVKGRSFDHGIYVLEDPGGDIYSAVSVPGVSCLVGSFGMSEFIDDPGWKIMGPIAFPGDTMDDPIPESSGTTNGDWRNNPSAAELAEITTEEIREVCIAMTGNPSASAEILSSVLAAIVKHGHLDKPDYPAPFVDGLRQLARSAERLSNQAYTGQGWQS